MAEQIGIVTEIDPGGWARVLTDRKGACGGCHTNQGGGCRSCLAGAKFESRVTNPLGAKPGDVVKVSLRSRDFFKGAAMLYLFPVVALLVGALTGAWIAGLVGLEPTAGGILGAVAGIGVAGLILVRLDRSRIAKSSLIPAVVEVLSSEKSSSPPMKSNHACCG
jgi:sigma-E factor negative regulatory protein RseC